jgi:hypothetical protein
MNAAANETRSNISPIASPPVSPRREHPPSGRQNLGMGLLVPARIGYLRLGVVPSQHVGPRVAAPRRLAAGAVRGREPWRPALMNRFRCGKKTPRPGIDEGQV